MRLLRSARLAIISTSLCLLGAGTLLANNEAQSPLNSGLKENESIQCKLRLPHPDEGVVYEATVEISRRDGQLIAEVQTAKDGPKNSSSEVSEQSYTVENPEMLGQLLGFVEEAGIEPERIRTVNSFVVSPSIDGPLASVYLMRDRDGNVLVKAGTVGWWPGLCR